MNRKSVIVVGLGLLQLSLCAKELNILTVGNSFSVQMVRQLPPVASAVGCKANVTSLFIAGCPIRRHVENIRRERTDPDFRPYSVTTSTGAKERKGNVIETLKSGKWDIVTIQQASPESWNPDSYQPWANELISTIREFAPDAKIVVHETWSYCKADKRIFDPSTGSAGTWGFDQQGMYDRLRVNYAKLAKDNGFEVIPTGTAVQIFRKDNPNEKDVVGSPAKEQGKAGDSIHMNATGNYLQACVWVAKLFDVDVLSIDYHPEGMTPELAKKCRTAAMMSVRGGKTVGK